MVGEIFKEVPCQVTNVTTLTGQRTHTPVRNNAVNTRVEGRDHYPSDSSNTPPPSHRLNYDGFQVTTRGNGIRTTTNTFASPERRPGPFIASR